MSEYEEIKCTDGCGFSYRGPDRRDVLKAGFWHVVGQGHSVTRQDEIEDEFEI